MTLEELREHLLSQIGVVGVGAASSAEDAVFAETVLRNAQGELEQLGVALWQIDDVPEYAIESFCMYAAPLCAPRFGKSDEYPPVLRQEGLRRLRELTADERTSRGTAEYF